MQERWRLEPGERTSLATFEETWPAQASGNQDGAGCHELLG